MSIRPKTHSVQILCRFFLQVVESSYLCRTRIENIRILSYFITFIYDISVILSEAEGEGPASRARNRGPRRTFFARWGGKRAPVLSFRPFPQQIRLSTPKPT